MKEKPLNQSSELGVTTLPLETTVSTDDLHNAVKNADLELVKALIEAGADVNIKDKFGKTAFYLAVEKDKTKIAMILVPLMSKDSINATDRPNGGGTALHGAAINGNIALVKALIEAGADVDIKDEYNNTALYCAVANGNVEIAMILVPLMSKDSINAKDTQNGRTALHSAVNHDNLALVKALIEAGADVDIKDKYNNTALQYDSEEFYMPVMRDNTKPVSNGEQVDQSRLLNSLGGETHNNLSSTHMNVDDVVVVVNIDAAKPYVAPIVGSRGQSSVEYRQ